MSEDTIMNEFLSFLRECETDLLAVNVKLQEKGVHKASPTADELESIRKYGGDILAHRSYVTTCLAKFNKLLDDATDIFLPEKTNERINISYFHKSIWFQISNRYHTKRRF